MKIIFPFIAWIGMASAVPKSVIFDTDYGAFIDDIFALGLLLNSGDFLDLKYVLATSEQPDLSAKCIAKHIDLAGFDVPVGQGAEFPDYSVRGGVCAIPGLLGFALQAECQNVTLPYDEDGIASVAELLLGSGSDDWWYIVVGGQTSLMTLLDEYPEAGSKISTLIVMGGNWCSDFEPYPDVAAPTDETNIACDPQAANFVLDGRNSNITTIFYVPVVVADEIGGKDYIKIVNAARNGTDPGAAATLQFYQTWSAAGRADESLLIHLEALTYDPETESTPQFDACAVMAAIELLDDKEGRLVFEFFDGVHFYETSDPGLAFFPNNPRSAFSLLPTTTNGVALPEQCPSLTNFTFNLTSTPEEERPVLVALGFKSIQAKEEFYGEMADRMAGIFVKQTASPAPSNSAAVDYTVGGAHIILIAVMYMYMWN